MEPILTKTEDPDDSSASRSPHSPHTHLLNAKFASPESYASQSRGPQTDWNFPDFPKEPLGLIYLFSTPHHQSLNAVGEVRLGIILHEKYRGYGYAQQAVQLVVEYAFEELKCHRIQATLLQTPLKAHALKLFTRERFGHEGTRRGAFFSPLEQEWKIRQLWRCLTWSGLSVPRCVGRRRRSGMKCSSGMRGNEICFCDGSKVGGRRKGGCSKGRLAWRPSGMRLTRTRATRRERQRLSIWRTLRLIKSTSLQLKMRMGM
ncbi:hypothetical protein EDD18DRAFT_204217 [Armillaria luteobubalina]|uniref:N-acetyltransferase domain-containing protein n=1 Tax=Armillaria luteobubalina TaxID=153913 RepID=A0AA39Q731_9AGAR|nr:hypothetical protein EDD18DRAFT_204217 [Armillaria luteobubalina]